jgi:hypothetical protein
MKRQNKKELLTKKLQKRQLNLLNRKLKKLLLRRIKFKRKINKWKLKPLKKLLMKKRPL